MDSQNEITLHDDKLLSQEGLLKDSCVIIEQAQLSAYQAVNETLIKRNWLLGMRIQHEVLKEQRAEYGEQIIKKLAADLSKRYGKGFTKTNLYNYVGFYQVWPNIFHALSGKSTEEEIMDIFHAPSGTTPRATWSRASSTTLSHS